MVATQFAEVGKPMRVAVADLIIDDDHNRPVIRDKKFEVLCDDFRRNGITQPILIEKLPADHESGKKARILDGAHRYTFACLEGIPQLMAVALDEGDERCENLRILSNYMRVTPSAASNGISLIDAESKFTPIPSKDGKSMRQFTSVFADLAGVSTEKIRTNLKCSTVIGRDNLYALVGTPYDSWAALEKLAAMNAEARKTALERIANNEDPFAELKAQKAAARKAKNGQGGKTLGTLDENTAPDQLLEVMRMAWGFADEGVKHQFIEFLSSDMKGVPLIRTGAAAH